MTDPIVPGSRNWSSEVSRLRAAGYQMPNGLNARLEARRSVETNMAMGRGTPVDEANRRMASAMNRSRMASLRSGGMIRAASDMQMALPKIRQPGASLMDKGIPFDVNDPKALMDLRRLCRFYYSTHDLVPLLVDIYSKFPVVGLEFQSKDPLIEKFYSEMFLNELNYEEFLPDSIGREYFVAGEVTTLAHFNEELGIWSSEEVLDPDMVAVSKSMFVDQERVQLLVKAMVDNLRSGPQGRADSEERPSERLERNWQYCATPETKVLTAAMEWVPVRSLRLGDKIVGFDEFAPGGRGNGRSFRETEVTATSIINAPVFEVVTDGPSVTCTGAHMWLAQHKTYDYSWIRTDQLVPGDKIRYLGEWDYEDNADVGYVSGIFDGEGHFSQGTLAFSQHPGPVLDKALAILERYKFRVRITKVTGGCCGVRILGGIPEMARAMGIFRPIRLLPKFYAWLDGRALAGSSFRPVVVQSITPVGMADVVALATSTKTLMAAGMFSHNTQLVKNYPEIIQAAAQDDGLDIADALVSRLVNKASPWDLRGTPFLLRSLRTLYMEESLNAAQDAVADRLYSPMVLATMGIENMGDGMPWIPGQAELDDLREDMQTALAADFKLMVHNLGVKVESVFGRESVPDFSNDYDRIDAKLMQAWGIGQALIMGGTGAAGTYASSAINREVCEQLMMGFQKKVVRHMRKRMEVIAEAQEHYDFELKGGLRVPLYREIMVEDPDTGEKHMERVPKLLLPEVQFATLNLRDESTERQFIMDLKANGVPVSDKQLAVNIKVDFEQELEREAQETVDKGMAKAQAFKVMQDKCDLQGLPYPPELVNALMPTLQLRQMLSQTNQMEEQEQMMEAQADQMSPAGQVGALPGTMPAPGMPGGPPMDPEAAGDPQGGQMMPPMGGDPTGQMMPPMSDPGGQQMVAAMFPPMSSGPGGPPPGEEFEVDVEPPVNRSRPVESDEMRGSAPKSASQRWAARVHGQGREGERPLSKFELGPSSVGHHLHAKSDEVEAAIARRELYARHRGAPLLSKLVKDPDFYRILNMGGHRNQIQSDYPEIRNGGAQESADLLREMVERYEDITGVRPIWD